MLMRLTYRLNWNIYFYTLDNGNVLLSILKSFQNRGPNFSQSFSSHWVWEFDLITHAGVNAQVPLRIYQTKESETNLWNSRRFQWRGRTRSINQQKMEIDRHLDWLDHFMCYKMIKKWLLLCFFLVKLNEETEFK